jgi:peptidyl-prolyl cis-trans isomerase D
MGMMARMRSLAPAFILTVGGLFVLFMVISDSNVLEALGGRTNKVGSVNGDEITYQEFVTAVDRQREMMKQQSGNEVDENQVPQIRDQVWDALISQKLIEHVVKKFNISVSDDEIRDIILGDNPPDFLKQNFIDSLGRFNRQLYENALFDPQNKEVLLQAEEYVRQNRLNEKLQSMLLASINVSEQEIKKKFMDQNIYMNAEYALIDLNIFPDSLVAVTDEDLKAYYNENLSSYKMPAQRKLKFVLFLDRPSEFDSSSVRKILENVVSNVKSDTASFQFYVDIYSSQPYSRDTVSIQTFPVEVVEKIISSQPGSVIGPVSVPEGFVVYHLVSVIPSKETFVRASHILINQAGNDEANYQEAMNVYNVLIQKNNFEEIAKERSSDPGSGPKGGDLGWFGKGDMVPEFEKAVFEGSVGVIQKPVKTNFGYHIIKVTGRSDKNYVIEKIVNPVTTSAATRDAVYNKAYDFSYLANKNGFEKEAELMNYSVSETPQFVETAVSVPGLGANKRIVEFAFSNSLNTVSEVFKVPSGYVVVKISEVTRQSIKPFEEVINSIKPVVLKEKKYKMAKELADEVKKKIGNDVNKANEINSKIQLNKTGNFNASTGSVPGLGREYAFSENALRLDKNKVSEPIRGIRGYYLIKVIEKTDFDSSAYSIQRNNLRDQILQEKKGMYFNQWLAKIKQDADITDNRYRFFGE